MEELFLSYPTQKRCAWDLAAYAFKRVLANIHFTSIQLYNSMITNSIQMGFRRKYFETHLNVDDSGCEPNNAWADPEGETAGLDPPPPLLKNHKNIGFHSYTGPDPLKKHKATKPGFNVGPSSAR